MKLLIPFLLILCSQLSTYACSCDDQPIIYNLYEADVVFMGYAIDKTYSSDSLTYTISFQATQFFKNNRPEEEILKFTKTSEVEILKFIKRFEKVYTISESSCDFHLSGKGEWLVIADYEEDGISFGVCDHSRRIDKKPLTEEENYILNHLQNFDISQYRFHANGNTSITGSLPQIDIDSLVETVSHLKFPYQLQMIIFDFDLEGNLTNANFRPRSKPQMIVTEFGLSWIKNIDYKKPKNEFEKTALEIARKIKKWKPVVHKTTKEPVLGRATAFFLVNENGGLKIEY